MENRLKMTMISKVNAAQHSVHPTGGSRRVFRLFAWLGIGSLKTALSHPARQRVTPAVGRLVLKSIFTDFESRMNLMKNCEITECPRCENACTNVIAKNKSLKRSQIG